MALAALLWGLSNVVMRQAELALRPLPLMLWRFGLITVLTSPVWLRNRLPWRLLAGVLAAGALVGLATAAAATALETVSVDQMAFIVALYVVLTPLAMALRQRRWPGPVAIGATLLSLGGLALLIGRVELVLRPGTWLALGGAAGIAMQIVILSSMAPQVSPTVLTAWQSVGSSAALVIWLLAAWRSAPSTVLPAGGVSWGVWGSIAYLAVCGGIVPFWLQAQGQRHASPASVALAFNTEPLWTAAFAWLWIGQTLTPLQSVGAVLTVGALSANEWLSGHGTGRAGPSSVA